MIYFAYGFQPQSDPDGRALPGLSQPRRGAAADHRLCFPRYSRAWRCASAGFEASPGDVLWGALYDVPDDDLPVLHHHEGYDPDGPPELNRHDFREMTVLRLGGSEPVGAMTYVAIPDGTGELPSRAYIDTIIDGARYHQLPRTWLVVLEAIRTA